MFLTKITLTKYNLRRVEVYKSTLKKLETNQRLPKLDLENSEIIQLKQYPDWTLLTQVENGSDPSWITVDTNFNLSR